MNEYYYYPTCTNRAASVLLVRLAPDRWLLRLAEYHRVRNKYFFGVGNGIGAKGSSRLERKVSEEYMTDQQAMAYKHEMEALCIPTADISALMV